MGLPSVPPIIFVGNKKDLTDSNASRRAVTPDDVAQLMQTCEVLSSRVQLRPSELVDSKRNEGWPILHFEASALSGEKIDEMFEILVREIKDRRKPSASKQKKTKWYHRCTIL